MSISEWTVDASGLQFLTSMAEEDNCLKIDLANYVTLNTVIKSLNDEFITRIKSVSTIPINAEGAKKGIFHKPSPNDIYMVKM